MRHHHRTSFALLVLFVAGICVLWWADYAEVPTRAKQRELLNRLLPELIDTPVAEVRRIEVDRRSGPLKDQLIVERRGAGNWQLVAPVNAAADPELVETLARNLKDLRRSTTAGTIHGDPAPYGLAPPAAEVRVFVKTGKAEPVATLDLGTTAQNRAYVRPGGAESGIEVVDPRLLSALALPATRWRDTALFHVPSFRVKGVTVSTADPKAAIQIERDDRRWRLLSPIRVPADNDKAEGLVAELSALRVAGGADGFVADDVRERAAYGLNPPAMTVTVTPYDDRGAPQSLLIGKAVPGKPDEVYAMRGDQDDVVRLDVKRLREAVPGPNALRSQTALDLSPARIDRLKVDAGATHFELRKTPTGWTIPGPEGGPADAGKVRSLLVKLSELKASEFLDPARVNDAHLDPPYVRVRGWQAEPGAAAQAQAQAPAGAGDRAAEPKAVPAFDLALGRRDPTAKAVYGRVAGDTTVLALPDTILEALPAGAFALRDRAVLALAPTEFARVTVARGRSAVTVAAPPATGATGMHWTMIEPVAAPADESAVTTLLLTLGRLRAESWEAERVGDGRAFGLDAPPLRLTWTLQPAGPTAKRGVLRVGKPKRPGGPYYANVEGDPRVFTLPQGVIDPLNAELHARKVTTFRAGTAERVVIRWPERTLSLERRSRGAGQPPAWVVTPGYDPSGFNPAHADAVLTALADLKTPRFLQYTGPFPEGTGLDAPRVSVGVFVAGRAGEVLLRVGRGVNPSTVVATTARGAEGPVFLLSADDCKAFLDPPARPDDLPADVFAPEPRPAAPPPGPAAVP